MLMLLENGDFNRGCDKIQTPAFSTRTEHGLFSLFPVNASENGDFNSGHKSFLTECFKNWLGMAKKNKRSWMYMRENKVDLLYSFIHCGFSNVAGFAHP